ncbi:MAG TPA: ATP-binding cassette domain-containing protein [Chlamydiales bacterium]|nr:ATP-binding cassette domain-containing protein [Chlamydiales bacterium]
MDTSLKNALLQIGEKLQIEFVFSKDADFFTICEASGIRTRKVVLEEGWEKNHHDALLCFQNGIPVAYIDKKLPSGSIDPIAYMFYPPIPENIKTGKQFSVYLFKKYSKLIVSLLFYGLFASVIAFIPAFATSLLFRFAIPLSDTALVDYLFFGLTFSAIGVVLFNFLRNFCFLRFSGLADHFAQTALWDRLLKLPPHFFRKFSAGSLFWKMSSIDVIRQQVRDNASYTILNGVFAFLFLLVMFFYSPLLTFMSGLIAALSIVVTYFFMKRNANILSKEATLQESLQSTMVQIVGGIAKLRTTMSEKKAFAHWLAPFTKSKALQKQAQHNQNIVATYAASLPIFSYAMIYFFLIEVIGVKNLLLPDFLAFNIAFGSFILAMYPLNDTLISLVAILPYWKRSKEILYAVPEENTTRTNPGVLTGKIELNEITFGYEESQPLLNLSMTVQPGEFIGIVGPSGSGKSTLLRLLLGFEKPTSGAIYYDDQDLSALNVQFLRKQIGSVLQTSGIMSGTIYENIVGGGTYTPALVKSAIELAGFQEDLAAFPMGLHTYLPTGGGTISGGQKQRLLLARALIGSPSILILDEATSALDNQTQRMVTKNIDTLKVTRIVVAQRLSTIQHADRIYVLEHGQVVQTGKFEDLACVPGIFQEMYVRQKL